MKNLTIFFLLALITSVAQSQSLTEKEITGTWQVTDVINSGNNSKQADNMLAAYIDLYPDHTFQLRKSMQNGYPKKYQDTFKNTRWSFDESLQTVKLSNGEFQLKVSKNENKIYFEIPETGMKLEAIQPL